jgi:hypothetical protein
VRSSSVKIDEQDLQRAADRVGLSPGQAEALWQQLKASSEVEAHFEAAHVGYYFGALLVIGAMGWFMTNDGIRFGAGNYRRSRQAMQLSSFLH